MANRLLVLGCLGLIILVTPCYVTLRWQKSWQAPLRWQLSLWGIPLCRGQSQARSGVVLRLCRQWQRYLPWLRRFTHRIAGRLEIGGISPAWTGQVVTLLLLLPPRWRHYIHVRQTPSGSRSRGWWVFRFTLLELLIFRLWRR